jgi:hypothetical protein
MAAMLVEDGVKKFQDDLLLYFIKIGHLVSITLMSEN